MVALQTLCLLTALAGGGDVILLEFSSPRCEPCKAMQPTMQRLANEGCPIRKVDVEQDPELAARFKVQHVPTCVLVVNGQEAGRLVGMRSHAELSQLLLHGTKQVMANAAPQDYVVRGQSPETPRRGLGLFNRLGAMGGSKPANPGDAPMTIPAGGGANAAPDFGRDPAFGQREAAPEEHVATAQPAPHEAAPVASTTQDFTPDQLAMQATVRLRIEDATGHSFGTGTIIDTMKEEALVITCGHIFRESKGQGKIVVDLHAAGAREGVQGQLISFDLTRDIALVSIRPGVPVKPVPVAGDIRKAMEGARVFSIGCDHGRDPSLKESRIVAVNKYVGGPNYTVAGMPVEGRSGGGLFLADGSLIGICNAADQQDNEGLFAALPTVHWQLDQIGQTAIYKRENSTPEAREAAPEFAAQPNHDMVPIMPRREVAGEHDTEVICIVRSKSQPHLQNEVILVDRPTPELMDMLARSKQRPQELSAGIDRQPTSFRTTLPDERQIIRGQSK